MAADRANTPSTSVSQKFDNYLWGYARRSLKVSSGLYRGEELAKMKLQLEYFEAVKQGLPPGKKPIFTHKRTQEGWWQKRLEEEWREGRMCVEGGKLYHALEAGKAEVVKGEDWSAVLATCCSDYLSRNGKSIKDRGARDAIYALARTKIWGIRKFLVQAYLDCLQNKNVSLDRYPSRVGEAQERRSISVEYVQVQHGSGGGGAASESVPPEINPALWLQVSLPQDSTSREILLNTLEQFGVTPEGACQRPVDFLALNRALTAALVAEGMEGVLLHTTPTLGGQGAAAPAQQQPAVRDAGGQRVASCGDLSEPLLANQPSLHGRLSDTTACPVDMQGTSSAGRKRPAEEPTEMLCDLPARLRLSPATSSIAAPSAPGQLYLRASHLQAAARQQQGAGIPATGMHSATMQPPPLASDLSGPTLSFHSNSGQLAGPQQPLHACEAAVRVKFGRSNSDVPTQQKTQNSGGLDGLGGQADAAPADGLLARDYLSLLEDLDDNGGTAVSNIEVDEMESALGQVFSWDLSNIALESGCTWVHCCQGSGESKLDYWRRLDTLLRVVLKKSCTVSVEGRDCCWVATRGVKGDMNLRRKPLRQGLQVDKMVLSEDERNLEVVGTGLVYVEADGEQHTAKLRVVYANGTVGALRVVDFCSADHGKQLLVTELPRADCGDCAVTVMRRGHISYRTCIPSANLPQGEGLPMLWAPAVAASELQPGTPSDSVDDKHMPKSRGSADREVSSPLSIDAAVVPAVLKPRDAAETSFGTDVDIAEQATRAPDLHSSAGAVRVSCNSIQIGIWSVSLLSLQDLQLCFQYARKKLVVELSGERLKRRIEVAWKDICALRVKLLDPDVDPTAAGESILDIELTKPPTFYVKEELKREIDGKKKAGWLQCLDFTGGHALTCKTQRFCVPPGLLDASLKELLRCDARLSSLAAAGADAASFGGNPSLAGPIPNPCPSLRLSSGPEHEAFSIRPAAAVAAPMAINIAGTIGPWLQVTSVEAGPHGPLLGAADASLIGSKHELSLLPKARGEAAREQEAPPPAAAMADNLLNAADTLSWWPGLCREQEVLPCPPVLLLDKDQIGRTGAAANIAFVEQETRQHLQTPVSPNPCPQSSANSGPRLQSPASSELDCEQSLELELAGTYSQFSEATAESQLSEATNANLLRVWARQQPSSQQLLLDTTVDGSAAIEGGSERRSVASRSHSRRHSGLTYQDVSQLDPGQQRRILANRKSAARSKQRKQDYIQSLELKLAELHTQLSQREATRQNKEQLQQTTSMYVQQIQEATSDPNSAFGALGRAPAALLHCSGAKPQLPLQLAVLEGQSTQSMAAMWSQAVPPNILGKNTAAIKDGSERSSVAPWGRSKANPGLTEKELSQLDPAKQRRILANRQSAARSKQSSAYVQSLELQLAELHTQLSQREATRQNKEQLQQTTSMYEQQLEKAMSDPNSASAALGRAPSALLHCSGAKPQLPLQLAFPEGARPLAAMPQIALAASSGIPKSTTNHQPANASGGLSMTLLGQQQPAVMPPHVMPEVMQKQFPADQRYSDATRLGLSNSPRCKTLSVSPGAAAPAPLGGSVAQTGCSSPQITTAQADPGGVLVGAAQASLSDSKDELGLPPKARGEAAGEQWSTPPVPAGSERQGLSLQQFAAPSLRDQAGRSSVVELGEQPKRRRLNLDVGDASGKQHSLLYSGAQALETQPAHLGQWTPTIWGASQLGSQGSGEALNSVEATDADLQSIAESFGLA